MLRTGFLALATLTPCLTSMAQADAASVAPKGGYDTPGSFLKPLDGVGEAYERTLGAPASNMYMRQVRLKVLGPRT